MSEYDHSKGWEPGQANYRQLINNVNKTLMIKFVLVNSPHCRRRLTTSTLPNKTAA